MTDLTAPFEEYRVLVNGKPCPDAPASESYGHAVEHVEWHRKRLGDSAEIQARPVGEWGPVSS